LNLGQHVAHRQPDRVPHAAGQIAAEQRPPDDIQRKSHHRFGDVHPAAVWDRRPLLEQPCSGRGHVLGERVDVALGEQRLHEAALTWSQTAFSVARDG
jgi:hypothetical protein